MTVYTNFFGGAFFGGGFFGEGVDDSAVKTGTGGIDGKGRKRVPFKPTGELDRPRKQPKEGRKDVQDRVAESAQIQADVAEQLAREFSEETLRIPQPQDAPPVEQMSLAAIEQEIGAILRKKVRTQDEETTLLILMAAAAA